MSGYMVIVDPPAARGQPYIVVLTAESIVKAVCTTFGGIERNPIGRQSLLIRSALAGVAVVDS